MANTTFLQELLKAQPNLLHYAYSLTANYEEAHDLLQETFLRILKNESRYAYEHNFKAWASVIMRNIFINNYRNSKRKPEIASSQCLGFENIDVQQLVVDTPDSIISHKEIAKALALLPDIMREPFVMYVDGYSYQEISDKLSIPLGTVKSRIFLTKRKLRKALKDYM